MTGGQPSFPVGMPGRTAELVVVVDLALGVMPGFREIALWVIPDTDYSQG